ncbi:MAG TPA: T9SS type A sorting domain-containing protein [Candidatus Acidoferrales bacterium]|nr:T9SS type A sorting domain-containing protein [Candidatus Acidoferrales bacterium]
MQRKSLLHIPIMGLILLLISGRVFAQAPGYPVVPLDSVNFIPADSLKIADSLGTTGRSSLTNSKYLGDTITVSGIVIADPTLMGMSPANTSFYVQSTDSAEWGGMNIFGAWTIANPIGIGSVDTGYVIQLTGVLSKYTASSICGNFELAPIANQTIGIQSITNRPSPVELSLSNLVTGDHSSGGKVSFDIGTKYKGAYVIIRNVTVKTRTTSTSSTGKQWTVTVADSLGNTISIYDASKYFTARNFAANPNYGPPAIGSKIAYIRGILGAYSTYGYEIIPLYPGDEEVVGFAPLITATGFSSRRSPALPSPDDTVAIRVSVVSTDTAHPAVDSVRAFFSVNDSSYMRMVMTADTGSTYIAKFPPEPSGSLVKYYFKAWCNTLESISPDTSRAPLFYYVKSGSHSIKDIQYTPFKDASSSVMDLPITVTGIIQADTSDIPAKIDHRTNNPKTPYVFMQDAASAWSGIVLYDSVAYQLHRGDSVSVSGTENYYNAVNEIVVDSVKVLKSGAQPFAPVKLQTKTFGATVLSGDSTASRWKGVLVEFDSVHITNNDPDAPTYSITTPAGSFREYMINDGSGDCRAASDGSNTFSPDPHDTTWGYHIMPNGAYIRNIIGIMRYANSEYKIDPRANADFVGEVDAVKQEESPTPSSFSLSQNYPNPFNPTTTIKYSIAKPGDASLKIYNILGQEVATLVNLHQAPGNYVATFDASRFASGVYFYRLNAGSFSQVKKMLLLK